MLRSPALPSSRSPPSRLETGGYRVRDEQTLDALVNLAETQRAQVRQVRQVIFPDAEPQVRASGRAGLLQRADRGREGHWAALGQRVEGLRQRRDGRAHTQIIGRTGVHAAEEGGDNVVDEVVAKLLAH